MEFNSVNIDLFYVFTRVAELKSINKSSESLSLKQPAISKKIKQLENYVGVSLFKRTPQGMELTNEGKKLYLESKNFLNNFQNLKDSVNSTELTLEDLSVGVLDSISSYLYPQFFIDTMTKLKNVVISNKIFDLIDPFNDSNLDAIFIDSSFTRNLKVDYVEKELYSEPYFVVYSRHNKKADEVLSSSALATAENLPKLDLIMYPKYCPIHQRIVQIYDELGLSYPNIFEIDYSESTVSLVASSEYVTVLPKSLAVNKVTRDIDNLALKQLDIPFLRSVSLISRNQEISDCIYKYL
ncbi:LysR family transcriptional regulator [Companilactobacillus metriopterae]|uniref:LysR family transcriptional regulator n=1 Tax=Companilactobacillus metriopterae TaxID=1909267 RepID=UPI00100C2ECC|nr:LysR family transcriptional regulator [Companilactobacillus metriopterae]